MSAMAVFQVSTKIVPLSEPPKKKPQRLRQEWFVIFRFVLAVGGASGLFVVLTLFKGSFDIIFVLLPVFLYLAVTQFRGYKLAKPSFLFNLFFNSTPLHLLLTFCLALIYYGAITAIVVLIHLNTGPHIILVTTSLAWAVICDPVRAYFQLRIDRRFNLRDRESVRAVEAFASTLREEIDIDQLRERFLAVIRQTLQPYFVTLWVRTSGEQPNRSGAAEELLIADDDALLSYELSHPGAAEVDRLALESQVLRDLRQRGAELLLPLASQGGLIGLLILGPHLNGEGYTQEERVLLNTLAPQVAPALRVAQMVREEQAQVRERERIEQELRTARAIQHAFLPRDVPDLFGWRLVTYYQPAREVGGDFYDFLPLEDGRWGIVIGDVTGKGVPAALVMATVHTMLRSTVRELRAPGEILARVNDLLAAEIPAGVFVTCFFALLEPTCGRLCYANAGHEPPFRQREGSAAELWASGMPLGLMPGTRYEEYEVTLAPGENLLFYSDGLVEAHSPSYEMFGFPRMQRVLGEQAGHTNRASPIEVLLDELKRFTGEEWEQEDDVTMVVLQRMPEHSGS
jgi:serine phosphatase RsbU (regulator of sigma subunit)